MIMLRSCDVENCEDTSSIMVEFRRKDERIARPECQMMLSTRIIHINRIFIFHYFPKDVAVWPKWTRFDRRR